MYNSFFGNGMAGNFIYGMLSQMDAANKEKERKQLGITTNENGFEGSEKLNIPFKYDMTEVKGNHIHCFANGITSVYTTDGKFLFEGTEISYYRQGMFLVAKDEKDKNKYHS